MDLIVDPPELHSASEKFFQLSGEYTTVYQRLMGAATTMGEAWRAADNLAFVEQIKGFCDDLQFMADHLIQASNALKQQAANYETTRETNIAEVRKLAN
ncbi:MAG: WXG100 family type VII secretion target [Oscillospiraceae bacterium]|nr:WXG100 family type VII secretion target [Oscillospiraceae bacterium]